MNTGDKVTLSYTEDGCRHTFQCVVCYVDDNFEYLHSGENAPCEYRIERKTTRVFQWRFGGWDPVDITVAVQAPLYTLPEYGIEGDEDEYYLIT